MVVGRLGRNLAVYGDVNVDVPAHCFSHRGVDQRQISGFDPLFGELARDQQLE